MKREGLIKQMAEEKRPWDLLIIGGGATGLGVAVDASSRGYRVLLVEQHDFAKATSIFDSFLYHRVVLLRFVGRAIGLGEVFAFVQETDLEGAAGTAARSFAWRRGLPRRAIRRFENGDYIDAECS